MYGFLSVEEWGGRDNLDELLYLFAACGVVCNVKDSYVGGKKQVGISCLH
jgi:hypothetical protein